MTDAAIGCGNDRTLPSIVRFSRRIYWLGAFPVPAGAGRWGVRPSGVGLIADHFGQPWPGGSRYY